MSFSTEHYTALHNLFDRCDMGIGSLGRHRSGIQHIKTLKNREYAARGIPFIYSETDTDFENRPYILKVPANEAPVNIGNSPSHLPESELPFRNSPGKDR